jgi:hypothetical protein
MRVEEGLGPNGHLRPGRIVSSTQDGRGTVTVTTDPAGEITKVAMRIVVNYDVAQQLSSQADQRYASAGWSCARLGPAQNRYLHDGRSAAVYRLFECDSPFPEEDFRFVVYLADASVGAAAWRQFLPASLR